VDIVVTDLAMPGNDALWLMECVSRLVPAPPVILLSGYDVRRISGPEGAPFARKLQKPVLVPELTRVIREVLAARRRVA